MIRQITIIVFIAITFLTCFSSSQNLAKKYSEGKIEGKLDGVYEFISESTVLTKPRKTSLKRSKPEWGGVWHFQKNYYSCLLMERKRESFYDPKKLDDFGFESFSGTYELEGDSVRLIQDYAFNPYSIGRSVQMKYKIEGERLTMTQSLSPYLEDLREGTITIVLHRLK